MGVRVIALSRRIDKPDGSFGGVVVGTLKLSYFTRLFDRLQLGRDGTINLYLRDGTRIVRHPFVEADIGLNAAGSPNSRRPPTPSAAHSAASLHASSTES